VYSKQVEDAVLLDPDITDAAVIDTAHPDWDETVTAFVVLQRGRQILAQDIKHFLQSYLARYRIPKIFHFTDALPRTPTDKVRKFK